jgi:hypothetical protein
MTKLQLCLYKNFLPKLGLHYKDLESLYNEIVQQNKFNFLGWKSNLYQFSNHTENITSIENKFVNLYTHAGLNFESEIELESIIQSSTYYTHNMLIDAIVSNKLELLQNNISNWLQIGKNNVRFLFVASNAVLLPHRDNAAGLKHRYLMENKNYRILYDAAVCTDIAINFILKGETSIFRVITPNGRYDNSIDTSSVVLFDPNTHKHATSDNIDRLTLSIRILGVNIDRAHYLLKDKLELISAYP